MSASENRSTATDLHKVRLGPGQSSSGFAPPREEFLTVEHAGRPEHTPDVEGVLVRIADGSVTFTLEDGERFVFDESELCSALRAA